MTQTNHPDKNNASNPFCVCGDFVDPRCPVHVGVFDEATRYDSDADEFTRGTIPAYERIASRKLAQGSTNPKDNAPSNFWTLVEISQLSPKAKTALEQYITLAWIEEAKHYCDEGHYHDKKRDIAMLPSERVEELERLQRDSQPGE